MKLEEYRRVHCLTHAELAQRIGVTRSYATKLCNDAVPSAVGAATISDATGGQVTIEELLYPAGLPARAVMARQDEPDDNPPAVAPSAATPPELSVSVHSTKVQTIATPCHSRTERLP